MTYAISFETHYGEPWCYLWDGNVAVGTYRWSSNHGWTSMHLTRALTDQRQSLKVTIEARWQAEIAALIVC